MKKTGKNLSPLLLIILLVALQACKSKISITTAHEAFTNREYFVSSDMYKKAYGTLTEKEEKAEAAFGAAESYRRINDYKNAEYWYNQTLKNDPANLEALLFLATEMKNAERYEEAKEKFEEYQSKGGSTTLANMEIQGCIKAVEWKKENSRFVVENARALNTRYSDFAAVAYKNEAVYFSSDRENEESKIYRRTGDHFLDIYKAQLRRSSKKTVTPEFGKVSLSEGLQFEYNEAAVAFDKSKIYFTLCNGIEGKETSCKIYEATVSGKTFINSAPLSFCDDSLVNYGHPAISADGRTLFFSADLPGGSGGKDLYSTIYDSRSRTWGKPVNLGTTINTEKEEMYPFIHSDGTLYFSSNGRVGMGGLDIYVAKSNAGGWEEPVNMKAPVNSGADDFAYTFASDKQSGYLSSNRNGGKGKDDIYSFYLKPLEFTIRILVKDGVSGKPVPSATIKFRINADSHAVFTTNALGVLETSLAMNSDYQFLATKTEAYYFDSESKEVTTVGLENSQKYEQELLLNPINVEDEFTLAGIYYDVDKADLRSESLPVLDSLITLLNKFPKIKIEIGSHTDCRSPKSYNEQLSQRRAESVVTYLVSKKINATRLEAKGYGETRLVNDCQCEDGVVNRTCTEDEHQKNRRTTFRIISK